MWQINCICNVLSLFIVILSMYNLMCLSVNKERFELGLQPKYNPTKLRFRARINLYVSLIILVVVLLNTFVWLR